MSVERDAFGYRPTPLTNVYSATVAEAKAADTLQPIVALFLRLEQGADPIGYAFHPDLADLVAEELHRWASRAREKHYE